MNAEACVTRRPKSLGVFERYLTNRVLPCNAAGTSSAGYHCAPGEGSARPLRR